MVKTDTFDKYSLVYAWSRDDTKPDLSLTTLRVALDTPGSYRSHRTGLSLAYDGKHRYLSADAQLPYKQIQAAVRYEWTDGTKQVKGSLRAKGGNIGSLNAAVKTEMPGR